MEDKFKLFKKWFWIGILTAVVNFTAGLLYGVALVVEEEHRKEGTIIIIWSIISAVVTMAYLLPYLRSL